MKVGIIVLCAGLLTAFGAQAEESKQFMGEPQAMGKGTMRSYVELDAEGRPLVIGVRLSEGALDGLPEQRNATSRCFDLNGNGKIDQVGECEGDQEFKMTLPSPFAKDEANPFRWIGVNWNPEGHPPHAWSVPHFDFHFYMASIEEIEGIRVGKCPFFIDCEDKERASKPVPAQYVAEDHIHVGATVSAMGNHLIDARTPELGKPAKPFTHTWIYGAYDGHITFYEPMITLAYLRTKPNVCTAMRQPKAWEKSGYYPMKYCIRYLDESREITISMEDFAYRKGQ